jgi:two-component system, cell cycle sensor histidine kinase and response regulator CckA
MPSAITVTVLLVSGFCLFTAAYFLAVYFMMGRRYLDRLLFGVMTLLGFGFAFSMLFQLRAPNVETYRYALLFYLGIFIPNFAVFLWFSSYYTGYRPRGFLRLMTAVSAILWSVHWLRPYGLVSNGLRDFKIVQLPWGDSIALVRSSPSPWTIPFYGYLFLGLGYALRAGLTHVKVHQWRRGKGFLFSVVVSFLAGANNLLVDLGQISGPYISEVAVLAFILFMTLALAAEWRDQDLLYGEVFDAQNDAIFIHDPKSCEVLQVNATALRMFGASKAELLGQGLACYATPPSVIGAEPMSQAIRRCVVEGTQTLDGMARRHAQTLFRVEVTLRAATLIGRPRVIAVVRDVTEKWRTQESLREGERRFAKVVEASPVGMQFFRLEPDERLVLVGANLAADRLLLISHRLLVGKTLEEAFPELSGTEAPDRYRAAARHGQGWSTERVVVAPDHQESICEVLVAQTEPCAAVAMFLDVTERRRMERERLGVEARLQEAQRLESLGMLAGGVAHDFNNILQAIQGNVELLEVLGKTGPLPSDVFASVHTAVRRAADLCHQLLAYAGKSRLTVETIELGALVREVAHIVEVGVTKKARWEYVVENDLPSVRGDATQLRQVVLNLLTNAAESLGPAGGHVRVVLERTELDATRDDGLAAGPYCRLVVQDDGAGMTPEIQMRIFEPFFTTKVTGRGLGLAAVRGILSAHGGAIDVQSAVAEGTRMTVHLPVSTGRPTTKRYCDAPRRFHGRVLVLDDEESVRRVTCGLLRHLGLEVVEVKNAQDAIEQFAKDPAKWAGVMLDFSMPDLDGLETYRRMHALRAELPGLIASGYGLEDVKMQLAEFPRLRVIQKPYTRDELARALQALGWSASID